LYLSTINKYLKINQDNVDLCHLLRYLHHNIILINLLIIELFINFFLIFIEDLEFLNNINQFKIIFQDKFIRYYFVNLFEFQITCYNLLKDFQLMF